jgi:HprK-related kinase A
MVVPIARPVGLKNESIDIVRNFVRDAVIGPVAQDKTRGTVAHLRPPSDSVERMYECAVPQWVIFPEYRVNSPTLLEPYPKPNALIRLADNAFNYTQHGVRGFAMLSGLIETCGCFEFSYSSLDEATSLFESLVAEAVTNEV